MRDFKEIYYKGQVKPRAKLLTKRLPNLNDCRKKLRSCGLQATFLRCVSEEIDSRGWQAETNKGFREIRWHVLEGWRITGKNIVPKLFVTRRLKKTHD